MWAAALALAWASGAGATERFALLVGANEGWSADRPLRHAVDDAEQLRQVLVELGRVPEGRAVVLRNPDTQALRQSFAALRAALEQVRGDSLVLVYYSGHADKDHLHLRGKPLGLDELYALIEGLPAKVRLGIIDACKSGAILTKGGTPVIPFALKVVDRLAVNGVAVLTSSGADELSQEARSMGGSFFTHNLVSGLRGAADEDKDGKVTLAEAYRYASVRTTLDTADTAAGPQRPAFRFDLKGQGEVVLTELARASATLRFPAGQGIHYLVTDAAESRLLAEVVLDPQRETLLALPAGRYALKRSDPDAYATAELALRTGEEQRVASLSYRSEPLAQGGLKGPALEPTEADRAAAERGFAYRMISEGRLEQALARFDHLLQNDPDDRDARLGRARALIQIADRYSLQRNYGRTLETLALAREADPSLPEDPLFAERYRVAEQDDRSFQDRLAEVARREADRRAQPKAYNRWGVGLSLVSSQGVLTAAGELTLWSMLRPSINLSLFAPGIGAGLRLSPLQGSWSPFVGVQGHVSLVALGLYERTSDATYNVNERPVAYASTFDRVLAAEIGLQGEIVGWELVLGLAAMWVSPVGGSPEFRLAPVVEIFAFP